MSKFILSYRSAKGYDPFADSAAIAAWGEFLNGVIAPNVVDAGWPVFEPSTIVGEGGDTTQLGGYSIVDARDLEAAVSMARRCPTVERGGGVEVAVLADLPPEHPAEQMRTRVAKPIACIRLSRDPARRGAVPVARVEKGGVPSAPPFRSRRQFCEAAQPVRRRHDRDW
jgi:hypothetical protein